jgi:hypothetical protein
MQVKCGLVASEKKKCGLVILLFMSTTSPLQNYINKAKFKNGASKESSRIHGLQLFIVSKKYAMVKMYGFCILG